MKYYPLLKTLTPRMPTSSSIWNKELLSAYNFECTDDKNCVRNNFSRLNPLQVVSDWIHDYDLKTVNFDITNIDKNLCPNIRSET